MQVTQLYRYPVKGLSGEPLAAVELSPGQGFPLDRAFALAHGSSTFDPAAPRPLPKTQFLQLMRNERLAALQTALDEESGVLTVTRQGRMVARGRLDDATGRRLIEQFFAAWLEGECRGAPKLVQAPGHCFADCGKPLVSIIGLGSLSDMERVARRPVAPLRFRANIYFEGAAPWAEFDWIGRDIAVGGARLKVTRRIERCAATEVDPDTALRDMRIPALLQSAFGHHDTGVYAEVVQPGVVKPGDRIEPA